MEPKWSRRGDHIFYSLYFIFLFVIFYIFVINPPTFCDNDQLWCYEWDSAAGGDEKMVVCDQESINRTVDALLGHHLISDLSEDFHPCCVYRIITENDKYEGTVLGCLNEPLKLSSAPENPGIMGDKFSYKCYTSLCNPRQELHNISFTEEEHHRLIFQRPMHREYVKLEPEPLPTEDADNPPADQ